MGISKAPEAWLVNLLPRRIWKSLEVEGWADPHGVGIDQFLAGVCATVSPNADTQWANFSILRICRVRKFSDQVSGLLVAEEEGWLVLVDTSRCLVQIVP